MRNSLFAAADQVVVSGANFVLILICARYLPEAEQGKLGYIVAANFAAVMICLTAIFQLAAVELARSTGMAEERSQLAGFQVIIGVCIACVLATIVAFIGALSGWNISGGDVFSIAIYLLFQQLADFDRRGSYLFSAPNRALASSAVMYGLRLLLLWIFPPNEIADVLVLLIISTIVPALITVRASLASFGRHRDLSQFGLSQIFKSRWLIASGPISWVWGNAVTFVVGLFSGLASVGVVITIRSVTNIANVGLEMLETYGAVALSRSESRSQSNYRNVKRRLLIVGLSIWTLGLISVIFLGEFMVMILFGSEYAEYWYFLLPFWLLNLWIFLFKLAAIELRIAGRTREIFKSYLIGVVAMLISVTIAAKFAGLDATILAFAVSGSVLVAAIWRFRVSG